MDTNDSFTRSAEEHPILCIVLIILLIGCSIAIPIATINFCINMKHEVETVENKYIKDAQKYKWELNGKAVEPTKELLKEFKEDEYGWEKDGNTIVMYDSEHEPTNDKLERVLNVITLVSCAIMLVINSMPVLLTMARDIKRDIKSCSN